MAKFFSLGSLQETHMSHWPVVLPCPPHVSTSSRQVGGSETSKEAKALISSQSHSQAEKRRRERINTHLSTLGRLVPSASKVSLSFSLNYLNSVVTRPSRLVLWWAPALVHTAYTDTYSSTESPRVVTWVFSVRTTVGVACSIIPLWWAPKLMSQTMSKFMWTRHLNTGKLITAACEIRYLAKIEVWGPMKNNEVNNQPICTSEIMLY